MTTKDYSKLKQYTCWAVALTIFLAIILLCVLAHAAEEIKYGKASWYSVESCKQEGTSGIMANGRRLQDDRLTCAIWGYRFGTLIRVTNLANNKIAEVIVTDRGPSKKLVKKGRVIDLSKGAFSQIADLKSGIISVKIEVIK